MANAGATCTAFDSRRRKANGRPEAAVS